MSATQKDYTTTATSDQSESEELPPQKSKSRSRTRRGRRGRSGAQGILDNGLGAGDLMGQTQQVGDLARGVVGGVGGAVGPTISGLTNTGGGGGKPKGKDALSLRLDLNLEVEVTLKARIHGDLTLALLN